MASNMPEKLCETRLGLDRRMKVNEDHVDIAYERFGISSVAE